MAILIWSIIVMLMMILSLFGGVILMLRDLRRSFFLIDLIGLFEMKREEKFDFFFKKNINESQKEGKRKRERERKEKEKERREKRKSKNKDRFSRNLMSLLGIRF